MFENNIPETRNISQRQFKNPKLKVAFHRHNPSNLETPALWNMQAGNPSKRVVEMEAICEQQATDISPGAGTSESLKCYPWWYLYMTFLLFLYSRTFYGTSSLCYKFVCWEEFFLFFLMWKYTTTVNIVDNICVCVCICVSVRNFNSF